MNHLQQFSKIAFQANGPISAAKAIRLAKDEGCTAIYLVGENPPMVATLEESGVTVREVDKEDDLPADVFCWFQHIGFWVATRIDNGAVRDVTWAEDSLMATRLLLNRFSPSAREQYEVRPAAIEVLDIRF